MENYEFKRNYTGKDFSGIVAFKPDTYDNLYSDEEIKLLSIYGKVMEKLPKIIIPEDKEAFEHLVPKLDEFAKENQGVIEAHINFQKWEARIILYLNFFEISSDEEFELFNYITTHCSNLTISATNDGLTKVNIMIDYFDDIFPEDTAELDKLMSDAYNDML